MNNFQALWVARITVRGERDLSPRPPINLNNRLRQQKTLWSQGLRLETCRYHAFTLALANNANNSCDVRLAAYRILQDTKEGGHLCAHRSPAPERRPLPAPASQWCSVPHQTVNVTHSALWSTKALSTSPVTVARKHAVSLAPCTWFNVVFDVLFGLPCFDCPSGTNKELWIELNWIELLSDLWRERSQLKCDTILHWR